MIMKGGNLGSLPFLSTASARRLKPAVAWTALLLAALVAAMLPTFARAFAVEGDQNLVDPTQRADNSFIYDTTIESLFDQSSLYDNRTVQIVGEAIGDRIDAGRGMSWITLTVIDSEDKSSISVLMSNEQATQVDHFGKYGVVGTILQVRGTYHQACDEHDGLPDVHATDASVMSKGVEHFDEFNFGGFAPGIFAVLVGIALMSAFYYARERTR